MSRDAVWLRRSDDPQGVRRWVFRSKHNFRLPNRQEGFRMIAQMLVGAGLISIIHMSFGKGPWSDLMVMPIVQPLLTTILRRQNGAEAYAALPTLAGEHDALPIQVRIFDTDAPRKRLTGREDGWVVFSDGWLVYEGLRTSFALSKAQVLKYATEGPENAALRLEDGRRVELTLLTSPFQTERPADPSRGANLGRAVEAWLNGPRVSGEAVLPPRAEHPELVADRAGMAFVGLTIFALATPFFEMGLGILWASGTALLAIACLVAFVLRLRDLKRRLPTLIEGPNRSSWAIGVETAPAMVER